MVLKYIYEVIINYGIQEGMPDRMKKDIKIFNFFGLVSFLMMSFYTCVIWTLDIDKGYYVVGVGMITLILSGIFVENNFYILPRYVAILGTTIMFMTGIILYGFDSGFVYITLPTSFLPIILLHEKKHWIMSFGCVILSGTILYYFFRNLIPIVELPDRITMFLHYSLLICSIILIMVSFICFSMLNETFAQKNLLLVDHLTKRNAELKRFSYSTSHDLKQPLQTIINFISVIQKNKAHHLDQEGQHYLNLVEESSIQLNELIDALLSHSVLGQTSSFDKFDSKVLVKDVLADLDLMIRKNKASVHIGKLPKVVANRYEIGTIFKNLISNAIKFKKENISPVIQISAIDDGSFWRFIVKDNGIGIEESFQEKVFQMFQKVHDDRAIQGTGIGLANCKKIVEHHEGKIWIDSTINKGSTFSFTILKAPREVDYN